MEENKQLILSILKEMGGELISVPSDNLLEEQYECRLDQTQVFDGWSSTKRLVFRVIFNYRFDDIVTFYTLWLDNLTNNRCSFQKVISLNIFAYTTHKSPFIRMVIEELYQTRYRTRNSFFTT